MFLYSIRSIAILSFSLVECIVMDSPPETCLMENIACEAHSNNVIEVGDSDLATCRQMCSYREGCEYLTFYGSNSFPLHDYCMLFTSCDSQHQCTYLKSVLRLAVMLWREIWVEKIFLTRDLTSRRRSVANSTAVSILNAQCTPTTTQSTPLSPTTVF